ncbi:hypothetical protein VM1G_09188 [Cytospora mali]|uniref:Histone deacetylation protein Rxt3 n=1 Tax=Cytospora mali TaxID=578113 RepID=A0A194WBV3_CYTMA|nr:hypothetical protein VM1G_09188 [Valsa mali]
MDHRDPRQPGPHPPNLPFSRNAQSPLYTRQTLPPPTPSSASSTSAQAPYEPSASLTPSNHSRHHSSSSITPAPPMNRAMPPPGSPPQSGPGLQMGPGGAYGLPPPRPPPVSVGPPTAFPGGRELPALGSIARTGSTGSSMSISSMLGGLSQVRDPSAPSFAPPTTSPAVSAAPYASTVHASPRMASNHPEYAPYRRPHTPEQHQRMYEARDPRDPRDPRSTAGSPHLMHLTPEMPRYGTPRETYRHPPPPMGPVEHARELQRMSAGSVLPPRPSSQPQSFPNAAPPSRPMEMGRPPHPEMYARREELRPGIEYNPERPIVVKHEEERLMFERERQEREMELRERERREMEFRERERRERTMSGGDPGRPHAMQQPDYGPPGMQRREGPPPPQYARPPDAREQAHWQRMPQYDQSRAPYEEPRTHPRQHEYPHGTAPPYGQPAGAYSQAPLDRYPPSSHPGHPQSMTPAGHPAAPFESPERLPERHRMVALPPQQPPYRRPGEDGPPPPSVAYSNGHPSLFGSPRHAPMEEPGHPMTHQQNFLRVDMNRKGRISPLPQAVQGAQPQIPGPPGEAGIKSEFGRMFSGIGSGVSGLGVSSPVASGAQLPFSSSGLGRRDDPDHTPQDIIMDTKGGRDSSARKRRKLKEDEVKGDEETTGRSTPVGRAKRQKTHSHHHHQSVAHGQIRDPNARLAAAQPNPAVIIPPKPKHTISNKTVLDSIAHKPREHLGDFIYELCLKPARVQDPRSSRLPRQSYQSTPKPLPIDLIKGKEGSTLMVKVGKQHLTRAAREEITSRRAVWGTDVYTDDSDILAACIHGGWIRGEWPEDVDVELLGLDEGIGADVKETKAGKKGRAKEPSPPQKRDTDLMEAPPKTGPVQVPEGQDMHVMVLVMPKLEKYTSTVRFGIKSREWGGKLGRDGQRSSHDGLSFMIQSVRFVTNGAGPQSRLRGRDRRERMRKAMQEVEISRVFEVRVMPNTGSGIIPMGSNKKAPGSDGDKENRSVYSAERGSENQTATPQQQRSRVKEDEAEGPTANGGQADQNDQHNRDDDSGVGDVSGVGDDAPVSMAANATPGPTIIPTPAPGPALALALATALPTVASRLTPPADA